jgi:uncharacterized protein (TIGR02453 family)
MDHTVPGRGYDPGMPFTGLHPDAPRFYAELADHNTKEWWTENRSRYDEHVLAPFQALADDLAAEFGATKIFRPYRDVRFSPDKSPYKLHIGLVTRAPVAHYLQLSESGLMYGGGIYDVPTPALARFREIVDDTRLIGDLEATLEEVADEGFELSAEDALITAPRGYSADHPRIGLLRLKRLAIRRREEPAEWMWTPAARDRIAEGWRTVSVWCDWLDENLGMLLPR